MVCIDDEIPFEIPAGWEWTRLKDLCSIFTGASFKKEEAKTNGNNLIRVLRGGNILPFRLQLKGDDIFICKELVNENILLRQNDLVTPAVTSLENICKMACFEHDYSDITVGGFVFIIRGYYNDNTLAHYLQCVFSSPTTIEFVRSITNKSGQAFYNIGKERLSNTLIPMPPYKEQLRIVRKTQKLLPIVDSFNKTQTALDKLNENVNSLLRKSILQEAIQGKLIEQNPDDEPASVLLERIKQEKERLIKEKKIKRDKQESIIYRGDDNKYYENLNGEVTEITDQIPFDIPTSWQWVRLETVCSYIQRGKSPKYSPIKRFPVVAQKCNQWSGFSLEKALFIAPETVQTYQEERILQNGDLLWNSTGLGTLGRMAIYRSDLNPYGWAVADSHVTVIRPMSQIISDYLFSYFASPTVQSVIEDKADGSTKQKELATSTIKGYYVPLPPTKEQMRIVQQIRTLFQSLS